MTAAARGERLAVGAAVLGAAALAWWYTVRMALAPGGGCHGAPARWSAVELLAAFGMWAVMMAGMMLPTALPVTLALASLQRGRDEEAPPLVAVGFFGAGYLGAWTAYSALAALAQWGLNAAAWLSPATLSLGPLAGGCLLVAAGAFQWTPWKEACMVKCRSPLGFLLSHWRPGRWGALRMGLRYGVFCVGCCWLLMALSFALGVMNLAWMAVVTLLMVAEKALPAGREVTRAAGLLLAAWGAGMVVGAWGT